MSASSSSTDTPNEPHDEKTGHRASNDGILVGDTLLELQQHIDLNFDRTIRGVMELAVSRLFEERLSGDATRLRLSLIDTLSTLDANWLPIIETEHSASLALAHAPTPDEVQRAVRTLAEHAASTHRDRWELVIDLLADTPALEADRLYQAQRHAENKRWLLSHLKLLGTREIIAFMPDKIGVDRNASRVLERLRADGTLLGVTVGRDWRYPADQLDARGEPHEALAPVVREARSQGYDTWEILHWLARPCTTLPVGIKPGRPLDEPDPGASLDEVVSAAAEREGTTHLPDHLPSPFAWLARGDADLFERAAAGWLGP